MALRLLVLFGIINLFDYCLCFIKSDSANELVSDCQCELMCQYIPFDDEVMNFEIDKKIRIAVFILESLIASLFTLEAYCDYLFIGWG